LRVKLPEVRTKLVDGFIVPEVKLNAGPLTVNVVHVIVLAIVGEPSKRVTAAVVFPLYVTVPDARKFKINAVYVPVDDSVMLFTFSVDAACVNEVVP
jgi:hypothetical protein